MNAARAAIAAGPWPDSSAEPTIGITTIGTTLGPAQTADISDMILRDGRRCARC